MTRRDDPTSDAAVWQSAALLLAYPDERLFADLAVVQRIVGHAPTGAAKPLRRLIAHLTDTPLTDLQAAYVETFDTRRRHNLYLTYIAHGDTRKRGNALLRFKQTYLDAGFVLDQDDDGELPDHLCVVLEFAATVDRSGGRQLLLDHRAGLELLRLSLAERGSPWADALDAVCATLPPLRGDERDAVGRLAQQGPPAEEVGLSPYGGPTFDALLHETVDLPMPTLRAEAVR
jgi:nitrate reductase delta subunit